MTKHCVYEGLLEKIYGKVLGTFTKSIFWKAGGGREKTNNIVPVTFM